MSNQPNGVLRDRLFLPDWGLLGSFYNSRLAMLLGSAFYFHRDVIPIRILLLKTKIKYPVAHYTGKACADQ